MAWVEPKPDLCATSVIVGSVSSSRRARVACRRVTRAGSAAVAAAGGHGDACPARPAVVTADRREVVGFLLRCAGTTVSITGDTVDHRALRRARRGVQVDVMIVHVGGVRFRSTGPVRYTLTGCQAVDLVEAVRPRVAVPVHDEGWTHFADGPTGLERALDDAPPTCVPGSGGGAPRRAKRALKSRLAMGRPSGSFSRRRRGPTPDPRRGEVHGRWQRPVPPPLALKCTIERLQRYPMAHG
jgi:hypothetical protein